MFTQRFTSRRPCSQTSLASLWANCRKQATLARRRSKCLLKSVLHNWGMNRLRFRKFGANIWSCCRQYMASERTRASGWFCITEHAVMQNIRSRCMPFDVSERRTSLSHTSIMMESHEIEQGTNLCFKYKAARLNQIWEHSFHSIKVFDKYKRTLQ